MTRLVPAHFSGLLSDIIVVHAVKYKSGIKLHNYCELSELSSAFNGTDFHYNYYQRSEPTNLRHQQ